MMRRIITSDHCRANTRRHGCQTFTSLLGPWIGGQVTSHHKSTDSTCCPDLHTIYPHETSRGLGTLALICIAISPGVFLCMFWHCYCHNQSAFKTLCKQTIVMFWNCCEVARMGVVLVFLHALLVPRANATFCFIVPWGLVGYLVAQMLHSDSTGSKIFGWSDHVFA